MAWWQSVTGAILGLLCIILLFMGWRKSGTESKLDQTGLRRGLDVYIIVWGCSILFGAGFIIVMDWWLSPFIGVGVGTILAVIGLLWFINSSRYLRDSQKTRDQSQIDLLRSYRDVDVDHALILFAASAGVFALTMLLVVIKWRVPI